MCVCVCYLNELRKLIKVSPLLICPYEAYKVEILYTTVQWACPVPSQSE